jgi:hypothetical protein
VTDQPPETLQAIADEILAIIKGDHSDDQKIAEASALIGEKIKEDNFIDICNITKMLSDYTLENEEALNEIVAINEEEDN